MGAPSSSISRALASKLRRGGAASAAAAPSLRCQHSVLRSPPPPSRFFASSSAVADSASQARGKENGSRWSNWLLFVPGAMAFGLGTWQIFRRRDKINMLEYRQRRLDMEPMKLKDVSPSNKDLQSLEFRRVFGKGVFDDKRSIFVGPRSRSISGVTENGYYLITPLMQISDDPESVKFPVLVNRGWVPRSWRDKFLGTLDDAGKPTDASETSVQKSEEKSWWKLWSKKPKNVEEHVATVASVEVLGVIRGSEKPSIFVPANDPASSQWFYVDTAAIAHTSKLPADTLYIEDINEMVNPSNPYPVPKDVNTLIRSSVMPQDHLNYTLTWYSLSAAVTFMAFKRLRQKKSWR
ncbi:surfeit locus protein 1 isoform X1 [Syzygium oleosum]|uniref:surfeit locus protein 1 isoform X1 n=1 Tax=Syzygium oleosum TaxID=219896 RepID=UPI0011D2A05D|nr:surfeit locus protein 1 isoform X1 [Syzygium oleosum]XP_030455473.1 surfeit locus protein 1 isoform X1 [Syzygium oleosum]